MSAKDDIWNTTDEGRIKQTRLYCARDSAQTLHLFDKFYEKRLPHEDYLYENLKLLYERGLKMEARGFYFDVVAAAKHRITLRRAAYRSLRLIMRAARKLRYPPGTRKKPGFNPASNAHLVKLFTGKPPDNATDPVQFGFEVVERTPTGIPKMNRESLEYYAACGDVVGAALAREILRYRRATKQLSTYVDGLEEKCTTYLDAEGRPYKLLHVQQLPWVPVTGRHSTKPNCQNVPAKDNPEAGTYNLRDMFRARPGYVFVGADMAALEGRIVALQAGVVELLSDFAEDVDIHLKNAERLFKRKLGKKSMERQAIKTTFYAFLYWAKDETIWRRIVLEFPLITLRMVCMMTAFLRKTYPEIPAWWDWSRRVAAERDYAEDPLSGRRFKFFGSVDPNSAINFPVQSFAAEMINRAELGISGELDANPGWDTHIMVQAHDELLLECPDNPTSVRLAKGLLTRHMQQTHTYKGNSMVFTCETKSGASWAEAK